MWLLKNPKPLTAEAHEFFLLSRCYRGTEAWQTFADMDNVHTDGLILIYMKLPLQFSGLEKSASKVCAKAIYVKGPLQEWKSDCQSLRADEDYKYS